MDRKPLREFTHIADNFLTINNSAYKQWVFRYTFLELEKDLGTQGDITTDSIFHGEKIVKGRVIARESGIFAGRDEIQYFLVDADPKFRPSILGDFKLDFKVKDGEKFKKEDVLLEIEADVHDLLKVERATLNLFMRMSGVATCTRKIIDLVKKYDVLITPTRKTLWGLLDKKAVLIGGGGSHRINLSDAVLVKDTHMDLIDRDFGKVVEKLANSRVDCRFIEIEVNTPAEALETTKCLKKYLDNKQIRSICVLLLDNMTPEDIAKALEMIKKEGLYDNLLFEASGGITEKNIEQYAKTGVDIISMGILTNGVRSLNMSLKVG